MAYEVVDELLTRSTIKIDTVVLPIRDLVEATSSRVITELAAAEKRGQWMVNSSRSWETWAYTPSGVVFSLNPLHQARLLAMGFHHLVQRLVEVDVPIVLLAFPRMIENADYLFDKLRSFLPCDVSLDRAREAHRRLVTSRKSESAPN
jgi:hypothetical protein